MFLQYNLFAMMEVFNHAFDEQSCLGLQTTTSAIHVHQLVAHDLVVVQLAYALLVIHTDPMGEEPVKVKVLQQLMSVGCTFVPVAEMVG